MMLMRFRRYRVFLILAAILTFGLYRFSSIQDWDATETIRIGGLKGFSGQTSNNEDIQKDDAVAPAHPAPIKADEPAIEKPTIVEIPETSTTSSVAIATSTSPVAPVAPVEPANGLGPTPATPVKEPANKVPALVVPDRTTNDIYRDGVVADSDNEIGRQDINAKPTASPVHWRKQKEHFPVPTESLIHLPTGKPVKIRKIQHEFKDETRDAKIDREKKQDAVKAEFKRAWAGYKKNAWLQDELSPVTGKFRNPFCGWAATLVDALDTLWIMGLEEEFEEAANAVDMIDFTTSPRGDIPMFETTIRYLGGLLAAYDISNGKYRNLLTKAVELAEVLMGAFDTPNRMPVLFYRWKPAFASQPHRASNRCNLAELGSLSMEFTRLAQLTNEPKYYDAVARITDALADYQTRGTKLDGVFPGYVDASGCNTTSPNPASRTSSNSHGTLNGPGLANQPNTKEPQGYKIPMPAPVKEMVPKKAGAGKQEPFELQVISGGSSPSKAHIQEVNYDVEPKSEESVKAAAGKQKAKRVPVDSKSTSDSIKDIAVQAIEDTRVTKTLPEHKADAWECVPQGIESSSKGRDSFSMGGGQDSTYEYFSKQYVLLGGHDDTYRSMYLKTMDAVRKHMLFRPMTPDERDILISGAVSTTGHPEIENDIKLRAEVTHLTCFIGGMVGMGAKLFDIPEDIEIAKKLTDGCVWAYEVTETGIMPETATALPCKDFSHCPWNETMYWDYLDPTGEQRNINAQEYKQNKAILDAQLEADRAASVSLPQKAATGGGVQTDDIDYTTDAEVRAGQAAALASAKAEKEDDYHAQDSKVQVSDGVAAAAAAAVQKRQVEVEESTLKPVHDFRDDLNKVKTGGALGQSAKEVPQSPTHDFRDDVAVALAKKKASESDSDETYKAPAENFRVYVEQADDKPTAVPTSAYSSANLDADYQRKLLDIEAELDGKSVVQKPNTPHGMPSLPSTPTTERPLDPNGQDRNTIPSSADQSTFDIHQPLTHEEYVKQRIEKDRLPPGMVDVGSRKYILRPEAIESVWYMYRITGDPIWQEKGWRMYESIIAATHSEYGNSAIADVTNKMVTKLDEMESFWLAETLKYFYLLFSTPDVVSLDDWVLNTEAHPFRRPTS